jgi:hypothetical protein
MQAQDVPERVRRAAALGDKEPINGFAASGPSRRVARGSKRGIICAACPLQLGWRGALSTKNRPHFLLILYYSLRENTIVAGLCLECIRVVHQHKSMFVGDLRHTSRIGLVGSRNRSCAMPAWTRSRMIMDTVTHFLGGFP